MIADVEEHIRECREVTESWIEAFQMRGTDDGQVLLWASFIEEHGDLVDRHNALVREWNKVVPKYRTVVASKNIGRPLEASEAQCLEVLQLRKASTVDFSTWTSGASLRTIVIQTGLGLRTIRTIIGRQNGTDRTGKQTNVLHNRELNWQRMISWRAQSGHATRCLGELRHRSRRARRCSRPQKASIVDKDAAFTNAVV